MCLHTIMLDPNNPKRIYIAISAAGAFRSEDGGKTWRPINRGLKSEMNCRIRLRRWGTAFIASPCTAPARCPVHAEALGRYAER